MATANNPAQAAAIAAMKFAAANRPPPTQKLDSGHTFCDWDLMELLKAAPIDPHVNKAQVLAEMMRLHNMSNPYSIPGKIGSVGGGGGAAQQKATAAPSDEAMLAMRMRWTAWAPKFDACKVHAVGDKVFVWVIVGGNPVTLEDSAGLFPSDNLVTKLRMMEG